MDTISLDCSVDAHPVSGVRHNRRSRLNACGALIRGRGENIIFDDIVHDRIIMEFLLNELETMYADKYQNVVKVLLLMKHLKSHQVMLYNLLIQLFSLKEASIVITETQPHTKSCMCWAYITLLILKTLLYSKNIKLIILRIIQTWHQTIIYVKMYIQLRTDNGILCIKC